MINNRSALPITPSLHRRISFKSILIAFLIMTPLLSGNTPPTADDDTVLTHKDQAITIDVLDNDTDTDATVNRYVAGFSAHEKIKWPNLGLDRATTLSKFIKFRTTDPKTESSTNTVLFDFEFNNAYDGGFTLSRGNMVLVCGFHAPHEKQIINDIASFADWADGKWHSVGFTYDGTTLRTYFDGVQAGTPITITGEIRYNYASVLGRRTLSNSQFFTGEMMDFVVYDTALTPELVWDYHYHAQVSPTHLVLWGKLDETVSGFHEDSSGNAHHSIQADAVPVFTHVEILDEIDRASITIMQNSSHASANVDGTITYTPPATLTGTDSFQYTVADKSGAISNAATVTVTINKPPTANDDTTFTPVAVPIRINLIQNDSDDGVLGRYVANFDGNDRMTWTNLNLDGTPAISKFIRFKTTDIKGVLFDYEVNASWDAGISSIGNFLKLRLGLYGSPGVVKVNNIVKYAVYGDGQWHSTGFTFDGTTVKAYYDGVESGTPVGNLNGQTVRHNFTTNLGRRTITKGVFITSDFYDFVVYNIALTAEEALDYHNGIIKSDNQIVWGKMNEADYTKGLLDWSGQSNHGTAYGATPVLDTSRIDVTITKFPVNGTLANHLDGTVTYTPNPGFTDMDHFTYTLTDRDGAMSGPARVTVFINEPTPADTDGDGLENLDEQSIYNTDPNNPDTDGDGLIDGKEVEFGIDPLSHQLFVDANAAMNYDGRAPASTGTFGPFKEIQRAIDAAVDGTTIYVAAGQYNENINVFGRAITLTTAAPNDPETFHNAVINGITPDTPVVTFATGEGNTSILQGFTITSDPSKESRGILCQGASPTISGCRIINNTITEEGGGILCDSGASPVIEQCEFTGNTASFGGAIACKNLSSPQINRCLISGNAAQASGGGIYATANSFPQITNTIIVNQTAADGGGVAAENGNNANALSILNCTLGHNTASNRGGGLHATGTPTAVLNSIFWANSAPSDAQIFISDPSSTVSYSDIQGGYPQGSNIINADPLFIDGANGDFHIAATSPCKDAGSNTGAPPVDFDGHPRPYPLTSGIVDMGGDEVVEFVTLTITTDFGEPIPAAGVHSYIIGESVDAAIEFSETSGTRMTPSWSGTGSAPASGTGSMIETFTILEPSSISWSGNMEYKLNCLLEGNGDISGDLDGWYPAGQAVTVTVEPAAGHRFIRWIGTVKQSVLSRTITEIMDQPHLFKAVIAEEDDAFDQMINWYVLTLFPGWNFIAFPVTPLESTVSSVFPVSFCQDCSIPGFTEPIWLWDPVQENFSSATTIAPFNGYWFRYNGNFAVSHVVKGSLVAGDTSLSLAKGWNAIGSATTVPLPNDSRIAERIWGWGGVSHVVADELAHGHGFWLFARSPVSLNVGNSSQDTDADGIFDIWETTFNTGASTADTDNDGLDDLTELTIYNTLPDNPDTDNDGVNDGLEVINGTDPLVSDFAVIYRYDERDRLQRVQYQGLGKNVDYGYDDAHNLDKVEVNDDGE